jgi:hypothetical protein
MLYLFDIHSGWWSGVTWEQDVKPMLEIETALMDVAMDIPEREIDQSRSKNAGED